MEEYTYQNRKKINEVYMHDSLFNGIIIDMYNKKIDINLIRWELSDEYKKRKLTFENVLHFEFDRLDFWAGDGGCINEIFIRDYDIPQKYIKEKLEKAIIEHRAKKCSDPVDFFSHEKDKFINICLQLMSGDIVSIICEKMIIN